MTVNAPIQFAPIFRSYLWGGDSLRTKLNKPVPNAGIWAESWEVVDHGADQSVVVGGEFDRWTLRKLLEHDSASVLGSKLKGANATFPLLLKYLDCNNVLSVQVHPDDAYASKMDKPDLGKTEAWFIVDAKPNAVLYAGLKDGVTRNQLETAIANGTTEDCLHTIYPQSGDCVFIPAGTVHALGSGLIVAEIQQASDTTFRLFDWNRVDGEGKSRPLHIQQALDVIDFQRGPINLIRADAARSIRTNLVHCDKFFLDRLTTGDHEITLTDSFAIVTVPIGAADIFWNGKSLHLSYGQTLLLPASLAKAKLVVQTGSTVLLASLP